MNKDKKNPLDQKPQMDWTFENLSKNQRAMLRFQMDKSKKENQPKKLTRSEILLLEVMKERQLVKQIVIQKHNSKDY